MAAGVYDTLDEECDSGRGEVLLQPFTLAAARCRCRIESEDAYVSAVEAVEQEPPGVVIEAIAVSLAMGSVLSSVMMSPCCWRRHVVCLREKACRNGGIVGELGQRGTK